MVSWITLDVADGVAVGTMARPPVNAMSRAFMAKFAAARAPGRRLATRAPIKECVERGLGRPLDEGLAEEARCYVKAYLTEDAREGILAFLDKRPARFRGR